MTRNVGWFRWASVLIVLTCLACSDSNELQTIDEDAVFQPSDKVLLKPDLKVLDIGNSYTEDATAYLPYLVDKLGVDVDDVCLYKAILSGASYKLWYEVYHDLNYNPYEVSKVFGNLEVNVTEGTGAAYDGSLFRKLLKEESWDVVIIHQLGRYATNYEEWWSRSAGGYLKELLAIINDYQPDCTIGFLLVHSPMADYPTNEEHSSVARWEHIANATQLFVQNSRINILIPYGTAIQNLRTTALNNDLDLTRDGAHLGLGLARYTASCCYYEALLAHRTGVSVLGRYIPYDIEDKPEKSQYSVTAENIETAQKAAVLACRNPYICSDPNAFDIDSISVDL